MKTTVDVYEDVPKKPFLVRVYTLDVPNSQTSRVGIQRGTDFVCVREDYGKAVSEAKRESRRDRKSRWVTIEQVLLETSIIVSTKEGEPPATISEFVDAVDALMLPPIAEDDWDGVVQLAKQLHERLGDERLDALLEVLQAANDPDTRSPK